MFFTWLKSGSFGNERDASVGAVPSILGGGTDNDGIPGGRGTAGGGGNASTCGNGGGNGSGNGSTWRARNGSVCGNGGIACGTFGTAGVPKETIPEGIASVPRAFLDFSSPDNDVADAIAVDKSKSNEERDRAIVLLLITAPLRIETVKHIRGELIK
jgi:hypothetical protein